MRKERNLSVEELAAFGATEDYSEWPSLKAGLWIVYLLAFIAVFVYFAGKGSITI